jgi:hypothetical protein
MNLKVMRQNFSFKLWVLASLSTATSQLRAMRLTPELK